MDLPTVTFVGIRATNKLTQLMPSVVTYCKRKDISNLFSSV
uniref:Uncharacterized protein n=1 Tax=viral metagenome TaxID=1070528 RepID=A0A6C0IXE3_9ZZZZ